MFWKRDDSQTLTELGPLGEGGMCRVIRMREEPLVREVALKVLKPELMKVNEAVESFISEAQITAQLDHPNVPPVYAVNPDKKRGTSFTMKVLEGSTFQQMLDQMAKSMSVEQLLSALEVMIRVCDAVAFAHAKGIIHCDLKPANVMVGAHAQIYVVDWGLARRKSELPTKEKDDGRAVGTPAYMAPEQALGQNYLLDDRTDVFALGALLFRILTGRAPYVAPTAEAALELAKRAAVPAVESVAGPGRPLPPRLLAICKRALAPLKESRYQSVTELRQDLEEFIHGTARLPEKVFQAGEVIIKEGDSGDCAYIILDGHCQVTRTIAGKRQNLRLMGPGEMFGEAAVLTDQLRLATVTAIMETRLAVVQRSLLEDEMQRASLTSLAIRAVATIFLDLNGQTAALLVDQATNKAWESVLYEVMLAGRAEPGNVRSIPWASTLAKVAAETRVDAETVSKRVLKQAGVRLEGDRLMVSLNRDVS